jgi:predicted nucleic acid-binding protein
VSRYSSSDLLHRRAPSLFVCDARLFEALDRGEFHVVTSTLTLLEVLVQPLRKGQTDLAELYRTILLSAVGIDVVSITPEIAETAAALRARSSLSVPDAIQLAVAKARGALFLTNDRKIPLLPGQPMLVLEDVITS